MATSQPASYVERVRGALQLAVSEDHHPHQIALSFAFGLVLTTLPNLGVSILALIWVGRRFSWTSKLAFVAAITVMNPIVKGAVYTVSILLGIKLLGPIPGVSSISKIDIGLDAGTGVLSRLLLGNVLLAVGLALVGYVVVYLTAHEVRQHG